MVSSEIKEPPLPFLQPRKASSLHLYSCTWYFVGIKVCVPLSPSFQGLLKGRNHALFIFASPALTTVVGIRKAFNCLSNQLLLQAAESNQSFFLLTHNWLPVWCTGAAMKNFVAIVPILFYWRKSSMSLGSRMWGNFFLLELVTWFELVILIGTKPWKKISPVCKWLHLWSC